MPQRKRYVQMGLTVFCTVGAILLFYDTLFGHRVLLKIWRQEDTETIRVRLQKRRGKGKVNLYEAPIIQRLQAIAWGSGQEAQA